MFQLFVLKKTFSASIVEQRKWKRKRYPFTASSFRFHKIYRFRFHIPGAYCICHLAQATAVKYSSFELVDARKFACNLHV